MSQVQAMTTFRCAKLDLVEVRGMESPGGPVALFRLSEFDARLLARQLGQPITVWISLEESVQPAGEGVTDAPE